MREQLRLMAVHAHPDDEVLLTGGVLARCAAEGIETVVVTCTDGRQGFAAGFSNPGEPGHVPELVAEVRAEELRRSGELLGITHLEQLGYGDSGMSGWAANRDPRSFCNADVDEAAGRVLELIERYRPQVVITYDEREGLGHPDHVMACRVTLAAFERTSTAQKLYLAVRSESAAAKLERAREAIEVQEQRPSPQPRRRRRGVPDGEITTFIGTAEFATRKQQALDAHASQLEGSHWLLYSEATIRELFAQETFIRLHDATSSPLPETDLFAGLR